MMGNRSDRRLANLSNSQALEAVAPIRTSRADFHQGPERHNQLHTEAGYTTATGSPFTSTDDLALGAGSIYGSSNPSCSANQSVASVHNPEMAEDSRLTRRLCARCEPESEGPCAIRRICRGLSPRAEKPVRFAGSIRIRSFIGSLNPAGGDSSRCPPLSIAPAIRAADRFGSAGSRR